MSYTESTATASCQVADDFDLNGYLTSLTDFVFNYFDDVSDSLKALPESLNWMGDYEYEEVLAEFEKYVRVAGGKVLIELDSEENNNDSDIWDWLCEQIRQDVMTSKFMQTNWSTIDSKYGVECGTSYTLKDGTFIGSDDVQAILEKAIPELS